MLGKGNIGKVYKENGYAIKKYSKETTALHEDDILKQLKHQNIVEYINFDNYVLKMELCERDLFGIKGISLETKFNYLYQVLEGIEYIHSKNIAHMDIKTGNILIKNNTIKICDFDLSLPLENDMCRPIGGTPRTSPYEVINQFRGNMKEEIVNGKKVDVWSFGILFYNLIVEDFAWDYALPKYKHFRDWKKGTGEVKEKLGKYYDFAFLCLNPNPSLRKDITTLKSSLLSIKEL